MNKNKLHILEQIMNMWENDLVEGNGVSPFEGWCEDNIENDEQRELMNKVKTLVDEISYILDDMD